MPVSSCAAVVRERQQPENTLLYRTIAAHWQTFKAEGEAEGRTLPRYINEEFENFLR
jgi:hypothetical protein